MAAANSANNSANRTGSEKTKLLISMKNYSYVFVCISFEDIYGSILEFYDSSFVYRIFNVIIEYFFAGSMLVLNANKKENL